MDISEPGSNRFRSTTPPFPVLREKLSDANSWHRPCVWCEIAIEYENSVSICGVPGHDAEDLATKRVRLIVSSNQRAFRFCAFEL